MPIYEHFDEPKLTAPVLIASLTGWVDAGGAGTSAAEHIAAGASVIGRFDPDALYDFRSQRPTLDIVDGTMKDYTWPELTVRHLTTGGRDLLVMSGQEPDLAWRAFSAAVLELSLRLGVVSSVCLGAIPAAVPHTRPTPVLATASRSDLLAKDDRLPEGLLRVPGSAVNLVEFTLGSHGIPSVGFWAQVPHYISAPYPPAAIALTERVAKHLGVAIPIDPLVEAATIQREQLDALVAQQPETQAHIERLEQILPDIENVPSGESIASEIERFLRDQREGRGGI
ncbi:MAG: proteasome assembly chaperone family protein [Actinomycetota bacterium]